MKFSLGVTVAALAAMASARSVAVDRRAQSPLEVTLFGNGNTGVKASIKNTGSTGVNLLKRSTFLDDLDVEKIDVRQNGKKVDFKGVQLALDYENLPESVFTSLGAGETIEVEIDTAELHDFQNGGDFELSARGVIPYADANSTTLTGLGYQFESNTLTITVDGVEASKVHAAYQQKHINARRNLNKRSRVQSDCGGDVIGSIQQAHTDCQTYASAAAGAARDPGAVGKFAEFFRTEDQGTRDYAASRFDAMAGACSSTTDGVATVQCTPPPDFPCSDGVVAFALVPGDAITLCQPWFNSQQQSTDCHGQDKWSTLLHEFTHCGGVFPPSTDDHAYFYDGITQLSPELARDNADTYALFAHAIALQC